MMHHLLSLNTLNPSCFSRAARRYYSQQATLRMSSDASQDERRPKNRRRPSVASDDSSHATEPPMMRSSSGQSDNFSRAKTGQGTNRKCPRHDQTDIMNSEAHVARCDAYLLGQRPQLLTTAVGFQYEGSESIPSHAGVQLPLHDLQLLDALDRACGLKPGSSAPVFPGLLTQQMVWTASFAVVQLSRQLHGVSL